MVNKWTVTAVAALALMAVVLATALPAWAQNDNGLERDYAENGADPVATLTAVDPEGRTVYWFVHPAATAADLNNDGDVEDTGESPNPSADAAHFSISMDGVLTFKSPPDFETMMGGGTADDSNTYNVVVVSYDDALGATSSPSPITDETDENRVDRKPAYHKVTVMVTDVDEDGTVSMSGLQPQEEVALIATLKDDDASDAQITAAKWKWEQSSSMTGPWTLISAATMATYSPAMDVAGMYLRATATYDDKHGDDETAMAVSANPARARPAGGNAAPTFPDAENNGTADPQTRRVKENSPPGTAVGKPVVAGDAGDVLTYTLHDTTPDSGHAANFDINDATGQIMTKGALNTEGAVASYGVHGARHRPLRRPHCCCCCHEQRHG